MAKATKSTKKKTPEGKVLISVNVDKATLEKVQKIAWEKKMRFAEAYNEAFEQYVAAYEKKNKKIE